MEMSQEELDRQYNARLAVPEFAAIVERWTTDSQAAGRRLGGDRNLAYGPSAAERLDLYAVATGPAPLLVFLHGGYWRSMGKDQFGFLAPSFVGAGITVAVVGYALCPTVDMDEIVRQCRAALAWLYAQAGPLGIDRQRIHVAGHSAGAHLLGMLAATDWPALGCPADVIRSGCGLSGLYDLEPIRRTYLNADLRLGTEHVARNSPLRLLRPNPMPLLLSVGGLESAAFHQQSAAFGQAWQAVGNPCATVAAPGRNHFTLLDDFADPGTPLGQAVVHHITR